MTPEAIDNAKWLRRQSPVVSDVFWYLYDNTGEDRHIPFGPIERETGHPRAEVRRACRLLTRHGLAHYAHGLWGDDGLAGAGYGITKEGDLAAQGWLDMELEAIGLPVQQEGGRNDIETIQRLRKYVDYNTSLAAGEIRGLIQEVLAENARLRDRVAALEAAFRSLGSTEDYSAPICFAGDTDQCHWCEGHYSSPGWADHAGSCPWVAAMRLMEMREVAP